MRRFSIIFIVIGFVTYNLNALDLSLDGLISTYNYAEVNANNNEGLYTITSLGGGLSIKETFTNINLSLSIQAQLPINITYKDAFGLDSANYINDTIYWGTKSVVELGYPLLVLSRAEILGSVDLVHDYFYFSNQLDLENHYIFSTLGIGGGVRLTTSRLNKYGFYIKLGGNYSPIDISSRDGDLMWSYSYYLNIGVINSI
ncbi:MAG: hypothetical protein B6229_06875 [Spirochaetaceae bacterium 4572_7]|nr:MAG: hypothetical protein B6229_06875 [Spirochaetaceae bacterium 4572_7]